MNRDYNLTIGIAMRLLSEVAEGKIIGLTNDKGQAQAADIDRPHTHPPPA